jgi:hypothetical protein
VGKNWEKKFFIGGGGSVLTHIVLSVLLAAARWTAPKQNFPPHIGVERFW